MKAKQKNIFLVVVIALVTFLFLAVVYLIIKNGVSASTGVSCPQLMPMKPGWCPNGRIEPQPDVNGCPVPPNCISNDEISFSFNLAHGWNTIVIPQFIFDNTDPLSSSAFNLQGLTLYGFENKNWATKPTYLRRNASYLVYNSGQDRSVTVMANGSILVGTYNGYRLNPGWNLVGNNELFSKTPNKFNFTTYFSKPGCTTPLLCDESKTISQLFAEGRIYNKIYFFNNMQSTDPNVFYTTKVLSSTDLATYQIPALKAFWIYLYR